MGRSKETVNLPSKPIPKGFNIWVVANYGYVLNWLYYARDLLSQDNILKDFRHIIWLDNLFTLARLLATLKEEGFSVVGTVRT